MESTALIGHANAMDWQEEVYQKIQSMKEAYLPELNEMLEKVSVRIQQNESLVQVPKEHLEKFKFVKRMLECVKAFLHVSKHNVPPSYRDKIGHYEKKIINIVSFNRLRRPASSLQ